MSNRTLLDDVVELGDPEVPSTSDLDTFPRPANSTDFENGGNSTNSTTNHPFDLPEFANFIDRNPWVVYVAIGSISICVFLLVYLLLRNLCRKKKQVIRQNDDPVLTSTYDGGAENICYRFFCCRWKSQPTLGNRQNSESNLDPYKRPPLPPIGVKENEFHYISPFASNGLTNEEQLHGAYINAIRGVAHLPQRAEQYRALPPLRLNDQQEDEPKKAVK